MSVPAISEWIYVDEGELRGRRLQVVHHKPSKRGLWLEVRAEDGLTWAVFADGLAWRTA